MRLQTHLLAHESLSLNQELAGVQVRNLQIGAPIKEGRDRNPYISLGLLIKHGLWADAFSLQTIQNGTDGSYANAHLL